MDFDHHFVDLAVNHMELDLVDHKSLDSVVHIVDCAEVDVDHDDVYFEMQSVLV